MGSGLTFWRAAAARRGLAVRDLGPAIGVEIEGVDLTAPEDPEITGILRGACVERTLLLLMGLCTELDPTLNPMTVIRPYLERFVLGEDGDWSQLLVETSKDLVMSVTALPAEIRKFMRAAHSGELQLSGRGESDPQAPVHRI